MNVQNFKYLHVSKDVYDVKYDHKARWISYWYQIRNVLSFEPKNVLEIGFGNGLAHNYLIRQEVDVKTLDIDANLNPDLIGSVSNIPCADKEFDVVLCAQVLEHLPFEDFSKAISEIYRVSKKGAVISLPDSRKTLFKAGIQIPFFGWIDIHIKIPSFKKHIFDGKHYWEIGKRGFSLKCVKEKITASGFRIKKNFVPADIPTKHFFILEK